MEGQSLHHRIKAVVGQRSFREVADLTQTHPETVRRYVQGQAPSVEFLTALCQKMKINSSWLLTGQGPMHEVDVRNFALREANPSELLAAVAQSLELLTDRVIRLEAFVQTLEARVRAQSALQSQPAPSIESRPRTYGKATVLPPSFSTAWPDAVVEVIPKRPGADAGGTAPAPRS